MAVVWLNRSISAWNAPEAFDYWDENTQSIQPYGQTPQNGDTFYLNGYNITGSFSINIPNGKISNALNPYTDRQGGQFSYAQSHSVSCKEIEVGNVTFAFSGAVNSTSSPKYTGNIYLTGSAPLYSKGGNSYCSVTINGNVFRNSLSTIVSGVSGSSLIVNGNYEAETAVGSNVTNNITINGNCTLRNASINGVTTVSTINISGDITLINSRLVDSTSGTTRLGGHNLYYDGTIEPIRGFILNGVVFNSDEFTFHHLNNEYKTYFLSKYTINNTDQYPTESNVKKDVPYAFAEKIGTYLPDYPPETVVLKDFVFDNGDKVGSLENQNIVGCVTKEDVREGVPLIGMYEDGQQVVGTIIIPAEEDVREGVHYDNDKIGTLIVQGGGDRLRIADFGYYTNAQSDTYIVDITEADKPKFASAEERILIEMFPSLDLDNIPQMYFDDLFVKYLKYRLIVEYYRTAGVNSTFTPSEPTTEIVNYRNVTCEVWLNSANTYLNAWNKKYGLNKPPQKVRL